MKNFNLLSNLNSKENIDNLRKLIILACDNNIFNASQFMELNIIEGGELLDAWYELKLEESERIEQNNPNYSPPLNTSSLIDIGFDPQALQETINKS